MYKLLFAILFSYYGIFAQVNIPKLDKYATDLTGTLSAQELNDLNVRLKLYKDTTSNQLVVVMVQSLNGDAIEDVSYQIANQNKVGTKENSNGVLLFIAKDDKKLRIEVGYGLEGALTDANSNSIIRNTITPEFKSGNYYQGISDGINDIQKAIAGEYKAKKSTPKGVVGIFVFLIFIITLIVSFFRRGSGMMYRSGSGYRSGYWGGGGFGGFGGGGSSSGGGGFSGGGGSFGGGGSSGSW